MKFLPYNIFMSPEINIDGLEAQHLKGIFDQNGKALPEGFTTYVVTSPDGTSDELIAINLNTGSVIASSEMTKRIKTHLQGRDIFSGNIPNHERIFDKPQEKPVIEAAAPIAEKSDLEKKYENISIFDIFIDEHNPRFGN